MSKLEIIGLIASLLVLFSMVFKTTTFKGTMIMRILNLLGSIFFIIYGFLLGAYSTGICNGCLFFINIYYIVKEIRDYNKNKED